MTERPVVICSYIRDGGNSIMCSRECDHKFPHERKPWCVPWQCEHTQTKVVCVPVEDENFEMNEYIGRLYGA